MSFSASEKQRMVDEVPFWFHSIDVGDGVVSPGRRSLIGMQQKWDTMMLPEDALQDKTVLDIGAWDGYFSFEAERRGASRVVALDRYVYEMDLGHSADYTRMFTGGAVEANRAPGFYAPHLLPTKCGFDTAHKLLQSKVEMILDDLMTVDLLTVGPFDVVFYLGGLYHMADPLGALRRLALLSKGLVVIETAGIETPGIEAAMFEFYGAGELNNDRSNWWAPNEAGLIGMCKAAGFKDAKIVARTGVTEMTGFKRNRLFAHAWH